MMFLEKKYIQSYRGRAAGQQRGEGLYAERERPGKKQKRERKEKEISILFLIVCEKGVLVFK